MFQTFKNAWKTPELRKKLLFTVMIILLYRIGANLIVPYVNVDAVTAGSMFGSGSIFSFLDLLSGGSFSQATFFALSVSPYITASIVMQLLTIAIPYLENLSKQGEEGKKKITVYTRWCTLILALVTSYGYIMTLNNNGMLHYTWTVVKGGPDKFVNSANATVSGGAYFFQLAVLMACFCLGACLIMWLAEKIDAHGIGNGIFMILFANILSRAAASVEDLVNMLQNQILISGGGALSYGWLTGWPLVFGILKIILSLALALAFIVLIIWFTNSERRIPIQYAKRVVGRKMYGGQSSSLPLKMNMAGVMPVIFASSIVSIPATIASFMGANSGFGKWVQKWCSFTSPVYIVVFITLIFLFSYFYIMISFNPVEVSNNIRNQGGSIPGIRPGKPTADYIKKILNRVTLMGAVFLAVVAGLPYIITAIVTAFGGTFNSIAFAGTSLLIVVGVALETTRDLEAQLSMRNYKGFLD